MANEFKIKNGLIVSGSTEIEQNLIVHGTITGENIISGSAQIFITGTTGYSTFSSSISASISSLSASIAATDLSDDNRLDSLESASGSIRTDFNSFTSSYTTVSGSIDSRLDVLEAYSGSQLVPSSSMSFRTLQTDVYCKNSTGTQINKGTVVRIVGAVGDNPLIGIADPTTEHNSANTLGITTQDIPNDDFGLVITEGVLIGVNTSGMTAGDLLYLGASGAFTTTPSVAPNHGVRLGEVLRVQQNQGSIYVRIDNGMELNEAHDVIYSSISHGDLLVRSGSVWKNNKSLQGDYQITGSLMVSGSLNVSGSIVPTVNNQYDLGSPTHQFKDLYLSSASLYIDGTKVLGSTAQELQITTDTGQSFKILEDGSDNITLQSVDGNIELKSSGGGDVIMDPTTGVIALKGTTTLYAGNKLLSSDGNAIQVGNSLTVTGSMIVTDYIETQELRTTYISSSILYRSGSTKFGDELGDTHSFTGSLLLSGSLSTTNNITISNSYRPYFIANTSNSGEEAGIKIQQGTVSDWYFGTAQGTVSANDLAIRDVKNNRIPFYLSSSTGDAVFRKVNIQSPTVGSEVVLNVQNGANANGQHTLIKTGNGNKSLYTGVYLNDADVGYISMNSSPSNSIGIYINESGHTGFGVLNPGYNVHVVKDGSAGTNSNIVGSSIVSSRTSGQSENIAIRHTSSAIGLNGNEHAGQIVSHGNNSFEIYSTGAAAIILGTNATARIKIDSSGIYPFLNNTYNLGTATYGWANLYTNDLHLSNMNKPEGNDIDGTSGNWTIQEGDKNLYIINNNTNEKFKIVLQKI